LYDLYFLYDKIHDMNYDIIKYLMMHNSPYVPQIMEISLNPLASNS